MTVVARVADSIKVGAGTNVKVLRLCINPIRVCVCLVRWNDQVFLFLSPAQDRLQPIGASYFAELRGLNRLAHETVAPPFEPRHPVWALV